jgi:hypothetical protein
MITIETQKQFRDVANLPFCYWCGQNFQTDDTPNDDHVPPKNVPFRNSTQGDKFVLHLATCRNALTKLPLVEFAGRG